MNEVNYSPQLLETEFDSRAPIRSALRSLQDAYGIHDQSIAEFGSGLGYNLDIFRSRNKVIGIEGLSSAAENASARGVRTIVADLALAVPLESNTYDVVLCLDVLEHLMDPGKCLKEAYRLLRIGGIVVVNVPNHFSLSGRINIARGSGVDSVNFFPNHADWENPHVRFFRHASALELILSSGFRINADWTMRFPSIPAIRRWPILQNSTAARKLAARFPDLFAGGFFIIGEKPLRGSIP